MVYETPTRDILRNCFNNLGRFLSYDSCCNLGDPNRAFATSDDQAKFVIEWKTPWVLTTPTDIIKEFNETRDDPESKIAKAVSQIYGYMVFNNLRFGALCNYETLYLFRRVGNSGLQVSPPFRRSGKGTESIVAALVYTCHHVVNEESFYYSPVEQGPEGTHILRIDDFEVKGTWDENLEIPWEKMNLHLTGYAIRNIAGVMSGEVRPEAGAKFRYSSPAVFKFYEITSPTRDGSSKLQAADKEIQVYEKLKTLQGRYIPKLYAAGTTWKTLKFLILEDCGEMAHEENIDLEFWTGARKAILALHKAGVIHGDIKLDNFTISPSGVRVIDLGLCRQGNAKECADELAELESLKKEWDKFKLEGGSEKGSGGEFEE
ncbi:hypothetical protein TWF281_007733 [Arthrobotrys megalospora]